MTLTNGRTSAYQWDYGLKAVTTEAAGTVARFANEHGSKAIPVEAVSEVIGDVLKVVYHIPDILLTTGRAIVMYHLGGDGETSVYTTSEDFLPVNEAPKPDDYIFTEEEIRTWQELDERLTEAEGDIVSLESGKADVVHTHTESDISDLKDYIVEPTSDGTNGQVLTTNGSGGRSWTSVPTEVLRVVFTQSGSTVTADQTYDTIYAAISAGKDVFGLLNGKVYYFGGVSSGAVMEFYAQDIFTAATGEIKVTTRNIGMNSGSSVVYTETERLFAPKSHTHTESQITDLGDYISDPSTKSEGQVLTYNGSTWVAADGGGGGTSDYTELSNKPSINSTTLSGNKTSSDLGLAAANHTHSEYLTQETDPTVPSWAKASSKPSYTASEVGAIANPSTKYDGQVLTYDGTSWVAEDLPAETEEIFVATLGTTYAQLTAAHTAGKTILLYTSTTNDNVTIKRWFSLEELDNDGVFWFYAMKDADTVQWWSLGSTGVWSGGSKDFVPTSRTINSKQLNSDITLTASDVGAVPTTRTVNSKALSSDITLSASDVGAVPTTRKVNNVALSSDVTLGAADVGAIAAPASPASGDALVYSNSAWGAKALTPADIGAMPAPYSSFSPNEGDIIIWDSDNGRWDVHTPVPSDVGAAAASHNHAITGLSDVFLATYNSTTIAELDAAYAAGKKIFLSATSELIPLCGYKFSPKAYTFLKGDADDVSGDERVSYIVCYAGGAGGTVTTWATRSRYYAEIYSYAAPNVNDLVAYNNLTGWSSTPISDLGLMTEPTGASDGDVITYDSTDGWVASSLSASDVGAIPEPSSDGTSGQVLATNGSGGRYWTTVSGGGTPEVFIMHEDPITGYPTESPADIAAAFNAENLLVYSNGINYYYVNYISNDPSAELYMIIPSAAYQNISTLELTYDYTQQSWSSSFSSWDLVPTARKVNNKALSSDITLTSSDVGAIANPSSKTSGQFLSWNGSAWVATSLPVWNGSVT